eukprot:4624232-Prymnesium_polylepis.1
MQRGLNVVDHNIFSAMRQCWHTFWEFPIILRTVKWLHANDPFKRCFISIGSRLGSSTASFLAVSDQLIQLNL